MEKTNMCPSRSFVNEIASTLSYVRLLKDFINMNFTTKRFCLQIEQIIK